jgi:hypothetical protein
MEQNKEKQNVYFPFIGLRDTLKKLDCSKSFLYSLIREGYVKPRYLKGKPYFLVDELMEAMKFEK